MFITKEKLLELYQPQVTDKEIAKMYGVYPSTVTKARQKYGIPTHNYTDERRKILSESSKRHLKMKVCNINDSVNKVPNGWYKYEWDDESIDELKYMIYEKKYTMLQVANHFNVSQKTIERCMKKRGLKGIHHGNNAKEMNEIYAKMRKEDYLKIKKLYDSGYSMMQITKKIGHCFEYVKQCLIENGDDIRTMQETVKKQYNKCLRKNTKGEEHKSIDDYRIKHGNYYNVYAPEEAKKRGLKHKYVKEHILVWETYHNKQLPKGWVVHHINGVGTDNRIENLLAMPNKKHVNLIGILCAKIRELEERLGVVPTDYEEKANLIKLLGVGI